MSTRRKKEGVCGVKEKEKGGTSPSPSHHLRSSANRSSKTSRSLDSSPSEKAIPNYLRPTLSSSGDAAKIHTKKAVLDTDSGLKPNLVRRRSFDKPPSPTCTSKARGVSPTTTFRSSSFSGKVGAGKANATTSPKGDRGLKGTRDAAGKQHSVYARAVGSLKKSATSVKTKKADQSGSGGSRKGTKNDDHHHTAEGASDQDTPVVVDQEMGSQGELIDEDTVSYEQQQQQQIDSEAHKANSPTVLDEETAKVESPVISEQRDAGIGEESDGNGSSVESPTLLGHNDADNGDAGSEQHHDGDDVDAEVVSPVNSEQHVGSSTVSAQVQSQHDGEVVSVDSPTHSEQDEADKSCTEEMRSTPQEMKQHTANEVESTDPDPNGETIEGVIEEEAAAAEAVDKKAEVDDGEGQGVVVEEENKAPKVAHGKKDISLSNNVIEEMTREQRRNKVRALAGAFETVISLQDHHKYQKETQSQVLTS